MYQIFRNDRGKIDAINLIETGATVPTWDESDPLTIAFHSYCQEHPDFDISDHDPAPQPEPTPEPDWDRFRIQLIMNPAVARVATIPANAYYYPQLVSAMWQMGTNPNIFHTIAILWDAMISQAPLTPTEIEHLRSIATQTHMPFTLDEQGAIAPIAWEGS